MLEFEDILRGGNLAEQLNADQLQIIGDQVHEHYSDDRVSREDWEDGYSKWLDMACQKKTTKNKPFANCANIKYPLVTQAALAFNRSSTNHFRSYEPSAHNRDVGVGRRDGWFINVHVYIWYGI